MTCTWWMSPAQGAQQSLHGAREEGGEKQRQRGDPKVLANANIIDLVLLVAEAAAETSLEGGNMALAIFIPVLIISLLLGGAYIYLTRWGVQAGRGGRRQSPLGTWAGLARHRHALTGHTPWARSWGAGHRAPAPGSLGCWQGGGVGGPGGAGAGRALLWGPAAQPGDSGVSPAGVGTTPASACPSCTPTPTARSR